MPRKPATPAPPPEPEWLPVRSGLESTLRSWGERVGPDHAALVALVRGLADRVDQAGWDGKEVGWWRQYQDALEVLMEAVKVDDQLGFEALLDSLSKVGDSAES